jgi:hypothetical protein
MSSNPHQATKTLDRRPSRVRPTLLAVCALALTLLLGSAAPLPAMPSDATEAGRLHSALAGMTKLVNRDVRPPALRLASDLPGAAEKLDRLREPASTTRAQAKIALDELRQMGVGAALDPHYLPALVAAGRAYTAVSGQDPITGTTVNPDYLGLEPELAASAVGLHVAADDAGELSGSVKRLSRALSASKRRARRLEQQLRRLRAQGARTRER